jgi:hypothetical protein
MGKLLTLLAVCGVSQGDLAQWLAAWGQDAVTFGEFEDVMSQLPKDFEAFAKPNVIP